MSKQIYFNYPQLRTQLIGAKVSVIVAGRRTGKTDSIGAPYVLKMVQRMPGSCGGIVVPTFKHGLTNTIPGLLAALARYGYQKNLHYVIGKRPPAYFLPSIAPPVHYEHVITFYNGSWAVLISQDRPGSSNGLTLSWLLIDEAKFIDYLKLKEETLPANGGIKTHFGKHSYNHSMMVLSDMPVSKKGSWFLHYKDKMDPELIKGIEGILMEIWHVRTRIRTLREKGVEPPEYLRGYLRRLDRSLNRLRSQATYYKEYSTIENIQLLGEDYIKQMKRDLTPLTFRTSILCKRVGIAKDGFYSSMRERHKYNMSDFEFLDSLDFGSNLVGIDARGDADVNRMAPICIGMDYNANINWIVAGQPQGTRLNVIKSFYVKYERKLPALIADFCEYYANHGNKTVIYYYDTTALGNNYAVNDTDFYKVILTEFASHGWNCMPVYIGNPMHHEEKYNLINLGFAGKNRLTPFFNRQNNPDLLLAIETAGVTRGAQGFKKNKSGEKLPESEEDPLQLRTDGTDAFDTLYIGCNNFPQRTSNLVSISGVY